MKFLRGVLDFAEGVAKFCVMAFWCFVVYGAIVFGAFSLIRLVIRG